MIYRIEKKVFSIKIKNFLDRIILIPVNRKVNGSKKEIKPKLWYNKSDIKLPFGPIMFLISELSVKIKFGSSGE